MSADILIDRIDNVNAICQNNSVYESLEINDILESIRVIVKYIISKKRKKIKEIYVYMIKKDYSKLEKDDLLKIIEKLESRKKYGLIWDEEKTKEKFEKESENALPVLKEVKGKEIKTNPSKPTNILIEGDNYHALSVLNYTHQGKIDVIYIDPPYNTGNKDFVYNDNYVDREDSYRHSKWLSFITKRLRLAKSLLTDEGVIFISIGDDELAQLKILCDEIFGEENLLSIVSRKSKATSNKGNFFSPSTDYILAYAKNYLLLGDFDDPFAQTTDKYLKLFKKEDYNGLANLDNHIRWI